MTDLVPNRSSEVHARQPRWSASMITPEIDHDAPLLRTEFRLDADHGQVVDARWLVSAQGVFEAYLDSEPISTDVLSPGWSSYEWRLRYREYELTDRLTDTAGSHVLGLALGNGWFRGRLTWTGAGSLYGDRLAAIAQLEITYADGHVQTVGTDTSWTAGPSATTSNDLYDGQTIDARLASTDWLRPDFGGPEWAGVQTVEFDTDTLVPYLGPPVTRHSEIAPAAISESPTGRVLVDFGQNVVGWVKTRVRGEAGSMIIVRHAEVLEHGELGVRPLRSAEATDRFILSGGEDVFEPTFTFHGFRYLEVDGWPGGIEQLRRDPDALTAVVVSSQLDRIGTFHCSDPLLNQLHANVVWGQRGNFLDLPTDCPQRDERLGWTGDIAAFAPTAAFLFDVSGFLRDWLADLRVEQRAADGIVAFVIPDALKFLDEHPETPHAESTALWSDAAVWVPWAMWQAYGDRLVLTEAYPAMADHVRRVETLLSPTGLWDTGFQFGDWLDPDAPPEHAAQAKADPGVVATACLYRSASLTAETARILDQDEDRRHFDELAGRIRAAFTEHYLRPNGRIQSDCPTVYALAIVFGLLDEPVLGQAAARLVELVAANDYKIATGFAGTPFVCDALSRTGHLDHAYRLLQQRECPSWLYPVTMGATTIWERWDSMLPDGSINPGSMTSFNHYALGAVADWLHRVVGGIEPAAPGYAAVRIAPQPGGGISSADTSLRCPHGTIEVQWSLAESVVTLDVVLPDGVPAEIHCPGNAVLQVTGGRHSMTGRIDR